MSTYEVTLACEAVHYETFEVNANDDLDAKSRVLDGHGNSVREETSVQREIIDELTEVKKT